VAQVSPVIVAARVIAYVATRDGYRKRRIRVCTHAATRWLASLHGESPGDSHRVTAEETIGSRGIEIIGDRSVPRSDLGLSPFSCVSSRRDSRAVVIRPSTWCAVSVRVHSDQQRSRVEHVNDLSTSQCKTVCRNNRGDGSEMASEALDCCHTLHVHGR